jgi:hypothetical protein
MIHSIPPVDWLDGYQQITPEKLNRTLLAAKAQLEECARNRWRTWDISYPISRDLQFCNLPLVDGFQYVVDRITISGTYTGQPTIYFKQEDDSTPEEFVLPADGNGGLTYSGTIFAGKIVDGYTGSPAANTNNFVVYSDVQLTDMKCTVSLRSSRGLLSDTTNMSSITLYKDEDVLTAARFTADKTVISNFQDSDICTTASGSPKQLSMLCFNKNIKSTTPIYLRTDRQPGSQTSKGTYFRKLLTVLNMNFPVEPGQEIRLYYGLNTASSNILISTEGQTQCYAYVDLSATDFNRNPSNSADDFVVTIENNTPDTAESIRSCYIYILTEEI